MRAIVDRWVTPVAVILAAASVVFAATWTMTSRFGGTDKFGNRNAPRSTQGPVGRSGTGIQSGVIEAPIGSGPARQAPVTAGGVAAQSTDPASASGGQSGQAPVARNGLAPIGAPGVPAQGITPGSGDAGADLRQRDGGRQGARVSGGEADEHAEGSTSERTGRGRERH
jgi:hypothetical protein